MSDPKTWKFMWKCQLILFSKVTERSNKTDIGFKYQMKDISGLSVECDVMYKAFLIAQEAINILDDSNIFLFKT